MRSPRNDMARDTLELNDANARAARESGPVTTKLDLSSFTVFDASTAGRRSGAGREFISVSKSGELALSNPIGRQFKANDLVEILLNKVGTTIVVRHSTKGIPLKGDTKGRSDGKRASCRPLREKLLELQIELPVRFNAEWNEELKAWVGKR